MPAKPATVAEYLSALPPERRAAVEAVRDAVNRGLPQGYKEGIQYGMIGWCVPHSLFPAGYHCDPSVALPFAALASTKGGMSLHLMSVYGSSAERQRFEQAWKKTGKRLDMGKACVRFKRLEDVALDVVSETVARVPVEAYVKHYVASIRGRGARKAAATKQVAKPKSKPKASAKRRRYGAGGAGGGSASHPSGARTVRGTVRSAP